MSIPFFYEPGIVATDSHFQLSEETSKHCIQVLRMRIDKQLNITDGKGNLYNASIIAADKKSCSVKINSVSFTPQPNRKVSIAISLIKNAGRFEWFLEKATEMGVFEIIPLLCSRTERQHFRFDRMNHILIAAMLQSQQTWLPVLQSPTAFQTVIDRSMHSQKLIAHCEEAQKTMLQTCTIENNVQILIGPEGDFTTEEIASAVAQNYLPVALGDTRLRTETAGIFAAALLINL
jgi:16S rRNA (uracil1498-N3)-methyltransferase